jgi:hypothetical protein
MQNMNEILDISPDEPDVILPPIERVDEDEILFAKDLTYREEVRARARTVLTLMEHGMQVEETDHTTRDATAVFNEKEDLENHADKPDVILRLEAMLTEYDHEVVDDAVRMRRFIMNRLMEESQIGTKCPISIIWRQFQTQGCSSPSTPHALASAGLASMRCKYGRRWPLLLAGVESKLRVQRHSDRA